MAQKIPIRKFLVGLCEPIKEYLQSGSQAVKVFEYAAKTSFFYDFQDRIYVLEEYKKPLLGLNILVLISQKDAQLDEKIQNLHDITADVRYTKEYLKFFGNPSNYDFEVNEVFKKCDNAGLSRLDLHFLAGMDQFNVFRVLLYRLNQIFTLRYSECEKDNSTFDLLQDSHKRLKNILKLSKGIFDKKIVNLLTKDMSDLYLLLNHHDKMERYLLNFMLFIKEDSSFFESKKDKTVLYFFIKKSFKKMITEANQKSTLLQEKSRIDRRFVSIMDEISNTVEYFSSVLSKDELKKIKKQIQTLKK
jgi:hypothetical protein